MFTLIRTSPNLKEKSPNRMLYVDCPNKKTSLMVTLFLETPILSVEPFGSELNSMQNHEFCGHWRNSKQIWILKLYLQFNFYNFSKQKKEKIRVDYYNIFTINIVIIKFHANIIKDLDITNILYMCLLFRR